MRDPIALSGSRIRSMKWTVLGRDRSLPHLQRKLYHFLMGMGCFALYAFVLTRSQALWTLFTVGGTFVALDLMRLNSPKMNALALKIFGRVMRREELKSVTGNSFYIFGLITIVFFFPRPIVLLSIAFLAIGDPIAAVVGTLYGRIKLVGKKSLEGALANFVASWLAAYLIAALVLGLPMGSVLAVAWVGAICSVAAELLPLPIDDNFTIPVFSAIFLTLANLAFRLF